MGKLFKLLFMIAILAFIGLVGYAYIGPFFGADFSAPQIEVRQPLILNAD
jgi:O-antigen/teichoic acid export membrane protein